MNEYEWLTKGLRISKPFYIRCGTSNYIRVITHPFQNHPGKKFPRHKNLRQDYPHNLNASTQP